MPFDPKTNVRDSNNIYVPMTLRPLCIFLNMDMIFGQVHKNIMVSGVSGHSWKDKSRIWLIDR